MDIGLQYCIGSSKENILKRKKCKKSKCLSKEALQIAEERREGKAKEKKNDISI